MRTDIKRYTTNGTKMTEHLEGGWCKYSEIKTIWADDLAQLDKLTRIVASYNVAMSSINISPTTSAQTKAVALKALETERLTKSEAARSE